MEHANYEFYDPEYYGVDFGADFSEDDTYIEEEPYGSDFYDGEIIDAAREALDPEFRDIPDEAVVEIIENAIEGMSPEEIEGFFSSLKNIAMSVAPIALPMLGGALGTFVGGPAGTAIGASLGQAAGKLLAGGGGRRAPRPVRRPRIRPGRAPRFGPTSPVPQGGSSAAAQLMALISNPDLLKLLLGSVLGPAGRESVRIGPEALRTPLPSLLNAIVELAEAAAQEAHATSRASQGIPEYLYDSDGEAIVDTSDAGARAQILLEQLWQQPARV